MDMYVFVGVCLQEKEDSRDECDHPRLGSETQRPERHLGSDRLCRRKYRNIIPVFRRSLCTHL